MGSGSKLSLKMWSVTQCDEGEGGRRERERQKGCEGREGKSEGGRGREEERSNEE